MMTWERRLVSGTAEPIGRRPHLIERMLVYRDFSTAEIMGAVALLWISVLFWKPGLMSTTAIYSVMRDLLPQATWATITTVAFTLSLLAGVSVALDLRPKHIFRALALLGQTFVFSWIAFCAYHSDVPYSMSVGFLTVFALGAARAMVLVARIIAADLKAHDSLRRRDTTDAGRLPE